MQQLMLLTACRWPSHAGCNGSSRRKAVSSCWYPHHTLLAAAHLQHCRRAHLACKFPCFSCVVATLRQCLLKLLACAPATGSNPSCKQLSATACVFPCSHLPVPVTHITCIGIKLLLCLSGIRPRPCPCCAARLVAVTSQGVLSDPAEPYVYRFIIKPLLMAGELQVCPLQV